MDLPKSSTFLGIFCKVVKIYHFSSEIMFGNFYRHLAIFLVTLPGTQKTIRCLMPLLKLGSYWRLS